MASQKKVFLWTAPRCMSTAFERCMMEVQDSKIFHEPFAKPYHFGPERQSERYSEQPVDKTATNKHVLSLLSKNYDGVEFLFSKDMAYAIENHFDLLLNKDLKEFQHTFLIRNTKKTIPSLYKASVNKKLTGWDYFDPNEIGFTQLRNLYDFVVEKFEKEPIIIDADDLLMNPEGTVSAYCDAIGVPFQTSMLSWESGPVSDWDVWNGWHDNALKSTGFTKQTTSTEVCDDFSMYPEIVGQCVKETFPIYKFFQSKKLQPYKV